eukprot:CAMPEP_0116873110 /NCGR_PEP_ID=MMETSP0463-20121206/4081_1 /TAXON_ID=181622 /ORGANISM="Strombidinopsis sp, Strain SopsisLIS2011" /LENGTH=70 /DNA_ID=CAMNT_0004514445 /DNA_START=686 /DNA_END=898 /DNA_ORIENTATION=-
MATSNFSTKEESSTLNKLVKKDTKKGTGGAALAANIDSDAEDNRLYMGGIPNTMSEEDVKSMCQSFGRLK